MGLFVISHFKHWNLANLLVVQQLPLYPLSFFGCSRLNQVQVLHWNIPTLEYYATFSVIWLIGYNGIFPDGNKIINPKQFGFQFGHSTDDIVIQLDDRIFGAFENNLCTLGVFINLSKSLWKSRSHDIAWKAQIIWCKSW